ncbi:MAG: ligase-associated DNA damage response endonuclease PdeM [Rubrivivax sp.]|nr:MAG: ligase-associated DNA damage response endonuclease PdeM [Rubrivivax sp.]
MTSTTPTDHWLCWPSDGQPQVRLALMPERAAFEPDTRTLFVADVHLGKAAVFRARGLPVPHGTSARSLARLSQALNRSQARQLVVLGDFLHARESHAPATLAALSAWRERHPGLSCVVIEGNHDVHAGQVHASFGIQTSTQAHVQGALRGVHQPPDDPAQAPPGALTLAGHVHPVVGLRGRTDRLRLPIFWLHGPVLTLPAFGEFTGGFEVKPSRHPDGQCFVIGDQAVLPLLTRR